jgi:hypothetical protein
MTNLHQALRLDDPGRMAIYTRTAELVAASLKRELAERQPAAEGMSQ